jgi:hypothetical protein
MSFRDSLWGAVYSMAKVGMSAWFLPVVDAELVCLSPSSRLASCLAFGFLGGRIAGIPRHRS